MRTRAVGVVLCALTMAVAGARLGVAIEAQSPAGAQASPPPPATGLIAGKVIDAATGAPISEVALSISGGALGAQNRSGVPPPGPIPPPIRRVVTDGQGRFLFRDLPAGSFAITTTAGGYMPGSAGTLRPGGQGQQVVVAADGRVIDVVIKLFKFGVISGTVTDEAGEPVTGVTIRTFRSDFVGGRRRLRDTGTTAVTDDRGVYRLSSQPPGDYAVAFVASPIAFPAEVLVESDRAQAAGSAANQAFASDAAASGARVLTQAANAVGDWRMIYGTNARPPAPADDGQMVVYPTTFHASSATAGGATIVTVGPGEEKSGIDFQIRLARGARVSGTLTGPDGPAKFFGLRLIPGDIDPYASEMTIDPVITMTTSTGAFSFLGVTPGSYTLKAIKVPERNGPMMPFTTQTPNGPATGMRPDSSVPSALPSLWASVPIQVGGSDVTDLAIQLKQGTRVAGRVEFDGATPPVGPSLKQIGVIIDPPGIEGAFSDANFFQRWVGLLSETATFRSVQLSPGRYFVRMQTIPPGWTLDSITANGRDITDVALDVATSDINDVVVRLTDKPAQLTGVVHDGQRQIDPSVSVLLFPADSSMWVDYGPGVRRLRTWRVSATGAFTIAVPPGDYCVVAINDADAGAFPDPRFLAKLAGIATRVTIERGQSKTQDLTTVVVR